MTDIKVVDASAVAAILFGEALEADPGGGRRLAADSVEPQVAAGDGADRFDLAAAFRARRGRACHVVSLHHRVPKSGESRRAPFHPHDDRIALIPAEHARIEALAEQITFLSGRIGTLPQPSVA